MHAHPKTAPPPARAGRGRQSPRSGRPDRPVRPGAISAVAIVIGVLAVGVGWVLAGGSSAPGAGDRTALGPSGSIGAETDPASGQAAPVPSADIPSLDPAGSSSLPVPSPSTPPDVGPFPGGVLVADRANDRILVLNDAGSIVWRFPIAGSLPAGWRSVSADDAFLAPDGRTIVANDETHETIVRIDIATRRVVWSYGHYGQAGSGRGMLHTPDDAYPLANGDIVVADIENCRILEIRPNRTIARQWGRTGTCADHPPTSFARPNGDTPLPDGGLLITEITGSRVVRLSATGKVLFDIHVPVAYPSDAQLDAHGDVVVADYSPMGQVVAVDPRTGRLVWRWRFASGARRLDHPSLATPLEDGTVSVNDDFRHRLVVIDPRTMRIVWQYGRTDVAGRGAGSLDDPDGHQPLPAAGPF